VLDAAGQQSTAKDIIVKTDYNYGVLNALIFYFFHNIIFHKALKEFLMGLENPFLMKKNLTFSH